MYYELSSEQIYPVDALMDERACAYADGFFSTMGVYQGRILYQAGHQARLVHSAAVFELEISVDGLMTQLQKLAHQLQEGILKVLVTRQIQPVRGYGYAPNPQGAQAKIFAKSTPMNLYERESFVGEFYLQKPIQATTVQSCIGQRSPRLSGLKLLACPEHVFAHAELLNIQQAQPDISDALVANVYQQWISATMGNVFYQLGDKWYTPSVTYSGVAGVVRAELMARHLITERTLVTADFAHLSAMCITNAVRGITPVMRLIHAGQAYPLRVCLPCDV